MKSGVNMPHFNLLHVGKIPMAAQIHDYLYTDNLYGFKVHKVVFSSKSDELNQRC